MVVAVNQFIHHELSSPCKTDPRNCVRCVCVVLMKEEGSSASCSHQLANRFASFVPLANTRTSGDGSQMGPNLLIGHSTDHSLTTRVSQMDAEINRPPRPHLMTRGQRNQPLALGRIWHAVFGGGCRTAAG